MAFRRQDARNPGGLTLGAWLLNTERSVSLFRPSECLSWHNWRGRKWLPSGLCWCTMTAFRILLSSSSLLVCFLSPHRPSSLLWHRHSTISLTALTHKTPLCLPPFLYPNRHHCAHQTWPRSVSLQCDSVKRASTNLLTIPPILEAASIPKTRAATLIRILQIQTLTSSQTTSYTTI